MNTEVIITTMKAVGSSFFSFSFIFAIWVIYLLMKKINLLNPYYPRGFKNQWQQLIDAIVQGTLAGLFGSFVIVLLGVPTTFTEYFMFLLPISMMAAMLKLRYFCLSYAVAILAAISLVFNGQLLFGMPLPDMIMDIPSLMLIVAITHLMEGLLIFLSGNSGMTPIVSKKDNKVIMGYLIQKFWPIPIAFLVMQAGTPTSDVIPMPDWWPFVKLLTVPAVGFVLSLFPIVTALGYSTVTFVEEPIKRTRRIGSLVMAYSICLIGIAYVVKDSLVGQVIGIILMLMLHESIQLYEQWFEKRKEPIFTLPESGIRIMQVLQGSKGEEIGLKSGEVILKINNIDIQNIEEYVLIMKVRYKKIKLLVGDVYGRTRDLELLESSEGIESLGIRLLPEKPLYLFDQNAARQIGLLGFFSRTQLQELDKKTNGEDK